MRIDLDDIVSMHKNEPKNHPLTEKCIAFPAVEMRNAPEVLLLEFFRETFFERKEDSWKGVENPDQKRPQKKELVPKLLDIDSNFIFNSAEQAVICSVVNTRKQSMQSRKETFYGPAYPALARGAWLRDQGARVIKGFLFEGILSQYIYGNNSESQAKAKKESLIKATINASLGTARDTEEDAVEFPYDVLRTAIGEARIQEFTNKEKAERIIAEIIDTQLVLDGISDPFSDHLANDALAVFELEKTLPRLQWLKVFMTYLRFAVPMWSLGRMKMVSIVYGLLLDAIDQEKVPSLDEVKSKIKQRYEKMLRPTVTPSGDLQNAIKEFMKRRIELNVLLYCLEKLDPKTFSKDKNITVQKDGEKCLPMVKMLSRAKALKNQLMNCEEWSGAPSLQVFISRNCEKYPAWCNPSMKGQLGNLIDEFWRVLRRPAKGDDLGGHLLTKESRGQGMMIFPGELLIQTVTQLAFIKKKRALGRNGIGRLVLKDIEMHFSQYGIDFSTTADVRPQLMRVLQKLGLLNGSPDSGPSAAVHQPF